MRRVARGECRQLRTANRLSFGESPSSKILKRLQVIDAAVKKYGAGNEARTRDLNLGKVALYQLSYSRVNSRAIVGRCCLESRSSG